MDLLLLKSSIHFICRWGFNKKLVTNKDPWHDFLYKLDLYNKN